MADVLASIPGAFDPIDAYLFLELARLQQQRNVSGDVLEIGVAYGRSTTILGRARRSHERFIVCDLFGAPAVDDVNAAEQAHFGYLDLTRSEFEANFLRFHDELPEIWQKPSSTLGDAGIADGSLRFAHIDGSHMYGEVLADTALVRSKLSPAGIVAFDDVFTGHAAGVGAVVFREIEHGLRPLATTERKLYGTWGDAGGISSASIGDLLRAGGFEVVEDAIGDRPLVMARPRTPGPLPRIEKLARDWLPRPVLARLAKIRRR